MLNERDSGWLAAQALVVFRQESDDRTHPSVLYRPGLSTDGKKWCALYGENLQDGVAGFGDSPGEAMTDFDRAWWAKLTPKADPE